MKTCEHTERQGEQADAKIPIRQMVFIHEAEYLDVVKEPTRQIVGKAGCGCTKTKAIRDRLKAVKS